MIPSTMNQTQTPKLMNHGTIRKKPHQKLIHAATEAQIWMMPIVLLLPA